MVKKIGCGIFGSLVFLGVTLISTVLVIFVAHTIVPYEDSPQYIVSSVPFFFILMLTEFIVGLLLLFIFYYG